MDFQLPQLKTLIIENLRHERTSKFVVHVFATSCPLQVFKDQLEKGDVISINEKRINQNAFANLIAHQVISFSNGLLAELAKLDQLQLRYLNLWDRFRVLGYGQHYDERKIDQEKDALHRLLSNQKQLEVFVSLWELDVDETTIKLMTEQQQNLKSSLLNFRFTSLENEGSLESMDGRDPTDNQNALVLFEEMLHESDSSRDLSNFVFLVKDERTMSFLEDAGFSIYQDSDECSDLFEKWSLTYPPMRKQLGIEFCFDDDG